MVGLFHYTSPSKSLASGKGAGFFTVRSAGIPEVWVVSKVVSKCARNAVVANRAARAIVKCAGYSAFPHRLSTEFLTILIFSSGQGLPPTCKI